MAYANQDFLDSSFLQDDDFFSQAFSMPLSAVPPMVSARPQATMSAQQARRAHINRYMDMTPRHIAVPDDYSPLSLIQEYQFEESYTTSSSATMARGRVRSPRCANTIDSARQGTPSTAATRTITTRAPPFIHIPGRAAIQNSLRDDKRPQHIEGEAMMSLHRPGLPPFQHEDEAINPLLGDGNTMSSNKAAPRVFCEHPDCLDESGRPKKSFSRKADLTRHNSSQHDITTLHDCTKKNCERKGAAGFTRFDHLQEHLRGRHGMKIPKRPSANSKENNDHNTQEKKQPKDKANDSSADSSSWLELLKPTDTSGDSLPTSCEPSLTETNGSQFNAGAVGDWLEPEHSQSNKNDSSHATKRVKTTAISMPTRSMPARRDQDRQTLTMGYHRTSYPLPVQSRPQPDQDSGSADSKARARSHSLTFPPGYTASQMMMSPSCPPFYARHPGSRVMSHTSSTVMLPPKYYKAQNYGRDHSVSPLSVADPNASYFDTFSTVFPLDQDSQTRSQNSHGATAGYPQRFPSARAGED